ncbi:secreted RxLR effector protein 161-like [Benincasa hispida]|uniref:secreted RxLR effector protein 161-like n=1 Tax=Benincasa hispida TaxID=102211 RepID=UPI001902B83B|nr:secreted RxLR effector protein 161-like [Benincasa hispida]
MSVVPYSQVVGSLMYLMVSTRPDIAYATSLMSRYMVNLDSVPELIGYVDSDYAKDLDKRRSLSGYIFLFGRLFKDTLVFKIVGGDVRWNIERIVLEAWESTKNARCSHASARDLNPINVVVWLQHVGW